MVLFRSLLLLGGGLMATFGSSAVNLSGAGPLGCLSMAFVAAFNWRKQKGIHGVVSTCLHKCLVASVGQTDGFQNPHKNAVLFTCSYS